MPTDVPIRTRAMPPLRIFSLPAGALNDFARFKRVRRVTKLYVSEHEAMPEIVN